MIAAGEKPRIYTSIEGVAADFGTSAPEYLEALAYYSQVPKPLYFMAGRWARVDAPAVLRAGVLTAAEQLIASWVAITTGSFKVTVGGVVKTVSPITFAGQTNMNGVATQINTALTAATAGLTVAWDGDQFVFTTTAVGALATVSYLEPTGAGVDISTKLKGTAALAAPPTNGIAAEAPVDAAARAASASGLWFGLTFASSVLPTDDQNVATAGLIEALELERMFGVTITNTNVLDGAVTNDLGSRLKALGYRRTFTQYSANSHAAASYFGRAFSVNFNGNRTTITLMYKQEPGIVAETITETQALVLKSKNVNVFVNYINDTAIIQYGTVANGAYFDEIHGLSWFKDALQNAEYNLLYQSKTKIPQTDDGQNQLINVAAAACDEAVNNGLCAPGQWNADGFGQLARGDYLKTGYYIFASPLALQDQSQREARIAPPIQIALKLAGAFQELDIIVDVNR
ncbi:hypothetical protein D3C76_163550 [compost metagenome]